ncbi:exocyst complex component sec6 [Acrodontium crateriforme]|uniref:Exocyst complex component sec6 n=1 Tax=Acrodontium crateriforme TaxID=150365 RepID=A0AAQ3MAW8_9PEZI|nr:exocyst complex component sec6 [Acrodontium crateriforme]
MNDGTASEDTLARLAELLRSPDDLDKLPSLKSEFIRKKTAIDAQLKLGLSDQLAVTGAGMASIADGHKTVALIKDEMLKIDKLCAEAQAMIRDFPEINRMSVMQRNFAAVEEMSASVLLFSQRLAEMEELLREDDEDLENQPNLLAIHDGLTGLRDMRDRAMEQARGSSSEGRGGLELIENLPIDGNLTMRDLFTKLDDVVDWFDEHVGQACINIIPLVQAENNGLVVRLALVIEAEEKKDKQVKALQDAQREFSHVASRFKSINVGQRELRGYKKKFLQAVEASAQAQFATVTEAFLDDPDKLEKACRWFFNDLNTVKLGMQNLTPKKWKIFRTYTNIYHRLMHDFLVGRLDDANITPVHMLAILNWTAKYYSKMQRLGLKEEDLSPHVIDDREGDLIREYRNLITNAVEEWMARMATSDRRTFTSREEGSLDLDADGRLHTKSLGDMWTMLREQLSVAESSGRPDVVEGVVDAMMRALKSRQQMWERLVDDEYRKIENAAETAINPSDIDGLSSYQDWLTAIANDQITNIDDQPELNITSFLTRFKSDYEPLVSPAYAVTVMAEHESLTNGYVDLATHCMALFASLIFTTDFRSVTKTFFTPTWYQQATAQSTSTMAQITTTFEDYLSGENNITQVLHPALHGILVEELSDALLVRYLGSVRNRGAKFRRQDPFTERIKADVVTVFTFFSSHPDTLDLVKDKWRAVNAFENLLSADRGHGITESFERLKQQYWDVQIGWVEAVLRARDDFERSMLSGVKNRAAAMSGERGMETVMSKVK